MSVFIENVAPRWITSDLLSSQSSFPTPKASPLRAPCPCLRIPKRAKRHAICAPEETWIGSRPGNEREAARDGGSGELIQRTKNSDSKKKLLILLSLSPCFTREEKPSTSRLSLSLSTPTWKSQQKKRQRSKRTREKRKEFKARE